MMDQPARRSLRIHPQYMNAVCRGEKTTTIRKLTRQTKAIRPGDRLEFLVRQASGSYDRVFTGRCRIVQSIRIFESGAIMLHDEIISVETERDLILSEGLNTREELIDIIRRLYGLPFQGIFILWETWI